MPDIQQNTLYLTTHGSYVARDHLTLQVEVPVYPEDLPREERCRERATDWRKLSIPIHMLESICVFGASSISPPALDLCWEHGVAVNYLRENGYLQARMTGVADTSVLLRRAQFRAADDSGKCAAIARQIIAGKLQNSRNSLLRAGRETDSADERARVTVATDALSRQIHDLGRWTPEALREAGALDLMEEFRAWLADRLAVTLVNRQQVGPEHFRVREGGAVEFTDAGRKLVITAYQQRKQDKLTHPLLEQEFRIAQFPFVQARILARQLRGDILDYVPFVPK
jgi:CRISPR/Cas system-associated endonuclease Cas1